MRLALTLALSLLCAVAAFAAPEHGAPSQAGATTVAFAPALAAPDPSAAVISPAGSILLHLHPLPWRPPAALVARMGLRSEPESGSLDPAVRSALLEDAAARRAALAGLQVQRRADGSRFLNLGGLVRAYTVATIGADGRVTQECVHSEQQAFDCVDAASTRDAATAPAHASAPAPASPREEK